MSKLVKQLLGECRPVIYRIPLTESVKPIIKQDKVIPGGMLVCPHCNQEIYEKHTYREGDVDYHTDCKGAIEFPPPDESVIQQFEKNFGMKYDRQTKKWTALTFKGTGRPYSNDMG